MEHHKIMKKLLISLTIILSIIAHFSFANDDYQPILNQAYQKYKSDNKGKVASYIPSLAKYSPQLYGIVLATADGKIYTVGNTQAKFPLESLSKIFALSLSLKQDGPNEILDKIGADATGLPFNSVTAVEQSTNHIGNALVNAGAMATVSLIKADNGNNKWDLIMNNLNDYADSKLEINQDVYQSEMATNQHNQAIAKLLQSYGHFYGDTNEAVDLYTRECSVDVSTVELAKMGAVLANSGKSPFNNKQLLDSKLVPYLLAEMTTAGMYDTSGTWLYLVGLPAKSGVSGGIVAIAPGKFAVAVYSPPLDNSGNSVRGQETIRYIANQTNSNIFITKDKP
ncbi:MAG: glutaminase [Pseudomonadota bacterium]|nr:glutaminase [Pseudomonadota bacterium]